MDKFLKRSYDKSQKSKTIILDDSEPGSGSEGREKSRGIDEIDQCDLDCDNNTLNNTIELENSVDVVANVTGSYLFEKGKFFQLVKKDGDKIAAKCSTCSKIINGSARSTGNFKIHIVVSVCISFNNKLFFLENI